MLEPKELEELQKICDALEKLGFVKPNLTITRANRADVLITIATSKYRQKSNK